MTTTRPVIELPACTTADAQAIVRGEHFRITVLTQRLLRLEWSETGTFEDRPTQLVVDRSFPVCEFTLRHGAGRIEIDTPYLQLRYDRGPFRPAGLSARVLGVRDHDAVWRYGASVPVGDDHGNLGGTARTLDRVDGAIDLEPGLLSMPGWSVVDDSAGLAMTEHGWVAPRAGAPGDVDLYLFAYADDAEACLRDFYRLTGAPPRVPRFALGNWWSRYHPYTDAEYRELIERFERDRLPLSVAVIDMDWHVTEVPDGDGWTGYTWNRDLFPDPPALLTWLHARGLRVTLNVHPADGVRAHEERYEQMAAALGLPADGRPLDFDIASREFTEAYLDVLHHPLEDAGVDFWWLDWQQGEWSRMAGLDPLWMLNHVHYHDSGRGGRRPLTLSRYSGVGSHRYPVGFSGDTHVTWASLDFQPYFTAAASNVGYGWWSHDIGGHFFGGRDDELATRWVQLGVFSPILRLHSGNDPFNGKEPWRFGREFEPIMGDWLRFRHRLVPYLYTMNERAHQGVPLVRPLHHTHRRDETLGRQNAAWFGELIVAPVTTRRDPTTLLGASSAWLPPGTWVDAFTGVVYDGGRTVAFHRPVDGVPVVGAAGSVVPLAAGDAPGTANPVHLELLVLAGADGSFTIYEDDDAALPSAVRTEIAVDWSAGTVSIAPAVGDLGVVPPMRRYSVTWVGVAPCAAAEHPSSYDSARARLSIDAVEVDTARGTVVALAESPRLADNRVAERVWEVVDRAQLEFATKRAVAAITSSGSSPARQLAELVGLGLDPPLLAAVVELVGASPDRAA